MIKGKQLTKKDKKRITKSAKFLETMWKSKRLRRRRWTKAKRRITSPTAATELVFITAEINATEVRDVAVIDAPGSFLTADIDKEVIVILENEMVDVMLEIDKDVYEKYVIHGKNQKNTCTSASAKQCMEHSRQH